MYNKLYLFFCEISDILFSFVKALSTTSRSNVLFWLRNLQLNSEVRNGAQSEERKEVKAILLVHYRNWLGLKLLMHSQIG